MKKSDIEKLEDKDLKLRYYLGGLLQTKLCHYWNCDTDCSCIEVPDDERILEVKAFIDKHNLTNERVLFLSCLVSKGHIMKYKGVYSPLFVELSKILELYNIKNDKLREIPDNDFGEGELESIVNEFTVKDYCSKYQLDVTDFITLSKTSLNYNLPVMYVEKNPNDTFMSELCDIIDKQGLYLSREQVEEYRKEYAIRQKNTQLVIEARTVQRKYSELMKELLIKDPDLATEMISGQLAELGFNSKKDVRRLVLTKK